MKAVAAHFKSIERDIVRKKVERDALDAELRMLVAALKALEQPFELSRPDGRKKGVEQRVREFIESNPHCGRDDIARGTGLKLGQVASAVSALKGKKLITSAARGQYKVKP